MLELKLTIPRLCELQGFCARSNAAMEDGAKATRAASDENMSNIQMVDR
jgi:hypothetical protein